MGDADEDDGAVVARACEWIATWLGRGSPTWDGPEEVVLFAWQIVIELGRDAPVSIRAADGFRFRLRLAPRDAPPACLRDEPDDGTEEIAAVLYVPSSLRGVDEGSER